MNLTVVESDTVSKKVLIVGILVCLSTFYDGYFLLLLPILALVSGPGLVLV